MTGVINYFFEANVSLIVFLLFYRWLLSGQTNFALMRFFLLAGLLSSIVLPFFHLQVASGAIPSASNLIPFAWLPEVIVTATGNVTVRPTESFSVWKVIEFGYYVGIGLFSGLFLAKFYSLRKMRKGIPSYQLGNLTIAESHDKTPTFSFFNFILIGNVGSLSEAEKKLIINHESVHAEQLHSVDIIIISIVRILFWFNPLITLYQKYIVELHEFEADARAAQKNDLNSYCSLLARVALQSADYPIANHFNNSLTLKRITMIRTIKRKINNWRLISASAVFPLLFFVLGFQDQVVAQETKAKAPQSSSDNVYTEVDEMPVYGKGFEDLIGFISKEMKYPTDAHKAKKEGTVFVNFIVEKDGNLSNVNVQKGFEATCDAEALRVVNMMKNWNPGLVQGQAVRTSMVLPIKFKLN